MRGSKIFVVVVFVVFVKVFSRSRGFWFLKIEKHR